MSILIILSILLGPLMASLWYFYVRYRFKQGHFALLHLAYFLGIFCVIIPALVYFILYLQGYTELTNISRILFYSFLCVGIGQELGKFIKAISITDQVESYKSIP